MLFKIDESAYVRVFDFFYKTKYFMLKDNQFQFKGTDNFVGDQST